MARGRELSQLGSLIEIEDSTKNMGVGIATPSQKIGIGTLSPTSKVEVVGDVFISGIITATTLSGDGSGLSNVPGSAFSNLSEDTTPQLGGNLDVNGKDITGTGNLNISGVITATSFSGNGSALIGVASTDNIQTATEAVFLSGVKITGVTTATGGVVGNLTGNVTGNTSGSSGSCTGNAATATILQTSRTIAGVSFDGSANISLNNNAITNGAGYITSSGTAALAQGLTGTPSITVNTVTSSHINSSGIITASSYRGDGSQLTGISADSTALKDSGANIKVQANPNGATVTGILTVTGDVSATNFNSTSDVTLKQDVSVIDNALEMISQLEGVSWKWKESLKPSLGVTAQNVEEVAPELVSNGDHKSVNYNGLIGILIEAVKELKSEVDELKR